MPLLSQRVDAPETPHTPQHPEVTWRPATADDIDRIHALFLAAGAVDHPWWVMPREDVAADFEVSYIDPTRDTMIAVAPSGEVVAVGTATLGPGADTRLQAYVFGAVHPGWRGRGLGRQLAAWQHDRALQHLARADVDLPGWIVTYAEDHQDDVVALFARFGLAPARYFTEMDWRPESAPPLPEIALPDGLRIEPFTAELSEATRLARNDSFRDHWGSQPTVPEKWAKFVGSGTFRGDLSRVVVEDTDDGPRVAAFALTTVDEGTFAAKGFTHGYVALVGVVREHRGRRLAPAVLTAQLRAITAAGLEGGVLDVDSESPTGALGLYERLGYTATHRSVALVREV
ncbi:GNAT family N-acetyltransferase [Georgenia alba]|uniref:GNAT family N-acetyltransferase n=1 Tax=Georgenia alba TaxID=2233858 RepID=A0ABW2Q3F0_9MICO